MQVPGPPSTSHPEPLIHEPSCSAESAEEIGSLSKSTTAGAATAAVTEKVWGEYVSVVCKILSLAKQNTKKHGLRSLKPLLFSF